MVEFREPWEFSKFSRALWNFLEEQYPMQEKVPEKLNKIPVMTVSQAETMASKETIDLRPISPQLAKLTRKLHELPNEIDGLLSDTHIPKDLNKLLRQLEHKIDFHKKYFEQHEGANWLARYVAEQCAVHYVAATGKGLGFGNDPYEANEPSSHFGRLVKNALSYLGVEADWRRPTKLARKYFDAERGIVTKWT